MAWTRTFPTLARRLRVQYTFLKSPQQDISTALPKVLYGADIWYTPVHGPQAGPRRQGSVRIVKRLTSVQRAATIQVDITGGPPLMHQTRTGTPTCSQLTSQSTNGVKGQSRA
ncbi:hypothetical protein BJV78DRAFT_591748 [Lactifluus subvellereus]|nr:hypothetical protein BJV78DRAFT_591748 [Lactifluus subvellereus]